MIAERPRPAPYSTAIIGLAMLAAALVAFPLYRAFSYTEIDINEGWNGYFQLRAMAGQPLYAGPSPLVFNNYPPLSFYLVGALGTVIGDPVLAGRLVSLAALGVIATACGSVVRSAGGSRWDSGLASATCLLLFACFATDYLGMNDPQLLGQAFAAAALAAYLRGLLTPGKAALVALLMAASVLIKHNLILLPLLLTGDVILRGPARPRIVFIGVAATLAALSAASLWQLAGRAFFDQLLAPRSWDVERAFLFSSEILGRYQAPLAAVAIGLYAARKHRPAGLVLAYLALALALGSWFAGGAGTDVNVYFDVMIALAIGAGLTAIELRRRSASARVLMALVLIVNAGVIFYAPLGLGRFGVDVAGELANREALFRADVSYLRGVQGKVICQSQLLCLHAGKPMIYDGFNANQAMLAGSLPKGTLTGMLNRHEIALIQISDKRQHTPGDPPGVQAMPSRFINYEDDVFDVLDREYVVDHLGISGRFWRPKA